MRIVIQLLVRAGVNSTVNGFSTRIIAGLESNFTVVGRDEFGNLVVSSASQIVFAIQMHLSRILNLPYSKIRVKKANMGGSFGG